MSLPPPSYSHFFGLLREIQTALTDTTANSYVPYTKESSDITSCGIPQNYDASKEFANKKVVLFGVPGTIGGSTNQYASQTPLLPTCTVRDEALTIAMLRRFHAGMLRQASSGIYREPG